MSKYLGCKGANFVFCPETPLRELIAWLSKQSYIRSDYHARQWAHVLYGHRAQILAMRFDREPSLGAHAHGKKFLFFRDREGFVHYVVVTNFIAWELEMGYVRWSPSDRHQFYVKQSTREPVYCDECGSEMERVMEVAIQIEEKDDEDSSED